MSFHTCHPPSGGSSHHRRRNELDRMFDGTVSPCEQAFVDLFVHDAGIDRASITVSNTEAESQEESREDDESNKVQVHMVLYKGEEIWRVEPTTNLLELQKESNDGALEHHSSKQRYQSTCVLLADIPQLEITIESTVSPVASDEEVLDEIATAPTSIWCNTTTAVNENPSSYGPGVIFRESRKINVENLIRAAAEEHQRLIAVPEEREATVVEYCLFGARNGAETSNGNEEVVTEAVKPPMKGNGKKDHTEVVKTATSMASESSSVYLNQEDDELSAQQQEAMNSFKVFNMNLFQLLERE